MILFDVTAPEPVNHPAGWDSLLPRPHRSRALAALRAEDRPRPRDTAIAGADRSSGARLAAKQPEALVTRPNRFWPRALRISLAFGAGGIAQPPVVAPRIIGHADRRWYIRWPRRFVALTDTQPPCAAAGCFSSSMPIPAVAGWSRRRCGSHPTFLFFTHISRPFQTEEKACSGRLYLFSVLALAGFFSLRKRDQLAFRGLWSGWAGRPRPRPQIKERKDAAASPSCPGDFTQEGIRIHCESSCGFGVWP